MSHCSLSVSDATTAAANDDDDRCNRSDIEEAEKNYVNTLKSILQQAINEGEALQMEIDHSVDSIQRFFAFVKQL